MLKCLLFKNNVPFFQDFEKLIKDWPSDLYNIQTLVNAVQDKLDGDVTNIVLLQCLAQL